VKLFDRFFLPIGGVLQLFGAICLATIWFAGDAAADHFDFLPNPEPNPENDAKLRDVGSNAENGDLTTLFHAGHGIQAAAQDDLWPIDATLTRERDLARDRQRQESVTLEAIKAEFGATLAEDEKRRTALLAVEQRQMRALAEPKADRAPATLDSDSSGAGGPAANGRGDALDQQELALNTGRQDLLQVRSDRFSLLEDRLARLEAKLAQFDSRPAGNAPPAGKRPIADR
jgi:hypothetical protein